MSVCMQRQILIKILNSLDFLPKRQIHHVFVISLYRIRKIRNSSKYTRDSGFEFLRILNEFLKNFRLEKKILS